MFNFRLVKKSTLDELETRASQGAENARLLVEELDATEAMLKTALAEKAALELKLADALKKIETKKTTKKTSEKTTTKKSSKKND